MKPIFKVGEHDYSAFLEKLTPTKNDLDAEGAGRDTLDAEMWRSRLGAKDSWQASFLTLPETIMLSLLEDVRSEFVDITILDPDTNTHVTKTWYITTRNCGDQRYDPGKGITVYDGANFKMTEK